MDDLAKIAAQYVTPTWWTNAWWQLQYGGEEKMTHFTESGDPGWLIAVDVTPLVNNNDEIYRQIVDIATTLEGIGYVAGGAARYLLVPRAPEPSDIDVFLYTTQMDHTPMDELGYILTEPERERSWDYERDEDELRVQVVRASDQKSERDGHSSYGPVLEVLSGFSFTTEQAAVYYGTGGLSGMISTQCREHTEMKVLIPNRIDNPVTSVFRAVKYGKKGYHIPMNEVTNILQVAREMTDDEWNTAQTKAQQDES